MDFELSEEAEQLRQSVRKWVERNYDLDRRRAIVAEGGFSREAYAELAELGVCGLTLPESLGGIGLDPTESLVVTEELGRGLVLEPFGHTLIAAALLTKFADDATQRRWAPPLAAGSALVVLAYQEPKRRYQIEPSVTHAVRSGDGFRISGEKVLVPAGDKADAVIVSAMADGKPALFVAPRDAAGLTARGHLTPGGARAATLSFVDTPAQLFTREGRDALDLGIDVGIAALAGEAVGLMERTLALTVDYLKTRKQFGVALASFQVLRHKVADMKMSLELARSMSYYASLKLGASKDERRRACSQAKVQLGASMRFVGQEAVQLHGGNGLADEYLISHCFRVLTQMETTFGDTMSHLEAVSASMQDVAGVYES